MYELSEQQIDFILGDISARGIGIESLQQNLLDHICCVIENDLEKDGDFERFYQQTITTFYKSELKEIEEETINLLTHKNYYIMKKIMLASGAVSVGILTLGIFFKFMHWPGAAACILLGVVLLSFVFLPLMFTLKVKEKQQTSDKIVAGIGTLCAIMISMGILFKIMHWPFATILCTTALVIMTAVFIPVYFFSGIRNPNTKVNTIVSSILMLAGCTLILTLIRIPSASKKQYISDTNYFLQNERIVQTEQRLLANSKTDAAQDKQGEQINQLCNELKSFLLQQETGFEKLGDDFERKGAWIGDTFAEDYFSRAPQQEAKLKGLQQLIDSYNNSYKSVSNFQPIGNNTAIGFNDRVRTVLNHFTQIQMVVLQNQRELAISQR